MTPRDWQRPSIVCAGLQVRILPTSFVLGQDGQIRYRAVGLLDWGEAQVVKLITALAPQP